jgi:hypothetical protein
MLQENPSQMHADDVYMSETMPRDTNVVGYFLLYIIFVIFQSLTYFLGLAKLFPRS